MSPPPPQLSPEDHKALKEASEATVTFAAPCKHCGCPNTPWFELDTTDEDNFQQYIECQHCAARTASFDDPDDAVRAWEDGSTEVPAWALPMVPWQGSG